MPPAARPPRVAGPQAVGAARRLRYASTSSPLLRPIVCAAAVLAQVHVRQPAFALAHSHRPAATGGVALRPLTGCAQAGGVRGRGTLEQRWAVADEAADGAADGAAVSAATRRSRLVQAWGVVGVAAYLSYGIKKVVPIVLEGLGAIEAAWQWALLAGTLLFFAYAEGYRGFQKGFAPRVVSRAWVVSEVFEADQVSPKELFKRYGAAYLLTSISFSLVSFTVFYALVWRGVDVPALLAAVGIGVGAAREKVGTAAIAYALHKAASPIRFPPTVAFTPTMARWMGKDTAEAEVRGTGRSAPLWHKALAPAFCIGYFHGTRRRVVASWCVTAVIFLVVVGVRRLANPYRAIIDAGVMLGLAWGVASILAIFAHSARSGKPPAFDPALPQGTVYSSPSS